MTSGSIKLLGKKSSRPAGSWVTDGVAAFQNIAYVDQQAIGVIFIGVVGGAGTVVP